MNDEILKIKSLKVIFPTAHGIIKAVEGIDFTVHKGECVALVGESGCGKSVSSLAFMKLLKSPPALIDTKVHEFDGVDILNYSNREMKNIVGTEMTMIFQDALSALNPVIRVGLLKNLVILKKMLRKLQLIS